MCRSMFHKGFASFVLSVFISVCSFAQSPLMGWNSYNSFGNYVCEDDVKANARYLVANMKAHGYNHVVLDVWSIPDHYTYNPYDSTLPWFKLDTFGRLMPDESSFPTSLGSVGFKILADTMHSMGLKFGIHVMRGVPRQAVWTKAPVKGANGITADMIVDTTDTCEWSKMMYGLDMGKPGAQEYVNSLLELYASWGVDFVKVDDMSMPYHTAQIEAYRKAINKCGRAITYSLSPGEAPLQKAEHLKVNGNQWRISGDIWDKWEHIMYIFKLSKRWEGIGGPNAWPDCDMLQIGKICKRGHASEERYSSFTNDELYTHMTLWSITKSPLFAGGNLPENRDIETKLLTNTDVIAMNQLGQNPRHIYDKDSAVIWISQMPDNSWNVAMFNTSAKSRDISFEMTDLGFSVDDSLFLIRDLWNCIDSFHTQQILTQKVNSHGTKLLRVSKYIIKAPETVVVKDTIIKTAKPVAKQGTKSPVKKPVVKKTTTAATRPAVRKVPLTNTKNLPNAPRKSN
jgi:alpha-galactosidase